MNYKGRDEQLKQKRVRSRGGRGRGKRLREEYTEPVVEVVEKKKPLNKKKVFADSDTDDAPPSSKKPCLDADTQKHRTNTADEVRIIKQFVFLKPSQFWRNLTIRGPFCEVWLGFKVHHNRPFYNLMRLIFYKIHLNCIDFMRNDLPNIMMSNDAIEPNDLMGLMCEKVLQIEVDGQFYALYVPHMMNHISRLFTKSFITSECNKHAELKNRLGTLCHVKGVEVSPHLLEKVRNGMTRQFYYMAYDLLTFVYETTTTDCFVEISDYRQFTYIPADIFETFITDITFRGLVTRLTAIRRDFMSRKLPCAFLPMIACEESGQLLENVLEFGLIQRLPEGVCDFLTGWMTGVRKRIRKFLKRGKMQEIVEQFFPRKEVPFTVTLNDQNLHKFLKAVVGKMLNSKSFTIFDGEWEEAAMEFIQSTRRTLAEPFIRFFEVSELINYTAKSALTKLLTRSVADRAMLYHTTAQLLRSVVYFVCFTIRHVFHYDGQGNVTYDGEMDEEFDGFDEFDDYEQNPLIQLPKAADVPTMLDDVSGNDDNTPDIHPVQLRLFPAPPAFNSSVPPPRTFAVPSPVPEQKFAVKTEKKSFLALASPVVPVPKPVKPVKTEKRSFLVKSEPSLASEVTEEELSSARALRPASSCASEPLRNEDIPQKWRDAYALTLEWNRDIRQQLDRIEKRYEKMTGGK